MSLSCQVNCRIWHWFDWDIRSKRANYYITILFQKCKSFAAWSMIDCFSASKNHKPIKKAINRETWLMNGKNDGSTSQRQSEKNKYTNIQLKMDWACTVMSSLLIMLLKWRCFRVLVLYNVYMRLYVGPHVYWRTTQAKKPLIMLINMINAEFESLNNSQECSISKLPPLNLLIHVNGKIL